MSLDYKDLEDRMERVSDVIYDVRAMVKEELQQALGMGKSELIYRLDRAFGDLNLAYDHTTSAQALLELAERADEEDAE